jgi:beta-xylosidase
MVALQNGYGTVEAAALEQGGFNVNMCVNRGDGCPQTVECIPFTGNKLYLRIDFNFEDSVDRAHFFYSADGVVWKPIGGTLHMKYTLDHFMGYRIGLFNYATQSAGGYADFDYFRYRRQG